MADILTQDVQHVDIDRVRPHPANPREGDVGAIWESIKENGFFGALVVQESSGHILAGNHRWLAAQETDMEQVPVIYVDVDDERAMRILLADNRTNDMASYDDNQLADLLEHLASTDEELAGTGYDGDALDELLSDLDRLNDEPVEDPGAEVDRAEELQQEWQTESGQLWQMGEHRLLCGDATNASDVQRLLDGAEPNLMVTDPPYGVNYDQDWRSDNRTGKVKNDDNADWAAASGSDRRARCDTDTLRRASAALRAGCLPRAASDVGAVAGRAHRPDAGHLRSAAGGALDVRKPYRVGGLPRDA